MKAIKHLYTVIAFDYNKGTVLDFSGAIPWDLVCDFMKDFQSCYPGCRLAVLQCSGDFIDF